MNATAGVSLVFQVCETHKVGAFTNIGTRNPAPHDRGGYPVGMRGFQRIRIIGATVHLQGRSARKSEFLGDEIDRKRIRFLSFMNGPNSG
jgi:hypothetical protein